MGKVAQKAIIFRENKVFLVRDPRSKEPIWELPGGRLNAGENPKEGLARELKEELGTEFNVQKVVYVTQFWHQLDNIGALVLVYLAEPVDPTADFKPDQNEVCEYGWFRKEEIAPLILFKEYREAILEFFARKVA